MFPKCPRCGGLLLKDNDTYDDYLTCMMCGRSYDFELNPTQSKDE